MVCAPETVKNMLEHVPSELDGLFADVPVLRHRPVRYSGALTNKPSPYKVFFIAGAVPVCCKNLLP